MQRNSLLFLFFCSFLVWNTFNLSLEGKGSVHKKELRPPKPPHPIKHKPLNGRPFIKGELRNQLGNQMFQIAATVSLALDNQAVAIFPDLVELDEWKVKENYQHVFWRLNPAKPSIHSQFFYSRQGFPFRPIPYQPNMTLNGLHHSEKYFAGHKKEIMDLFAPHSSYVRYLYKKYPLLKNDNTVAVHVRAYWPFFPGGFEDGKGVLPFLGLDYFKRAIYQFPADSLFVVFSNNMNWCKKQFKKIHRKFIFIEGEPHYLDLFMMSLCKHNIISNSSFSWWGAYLNKNPNKIVIAPKNWFESTCRLDTKDICPEGWVVIE